MTDKREIRRALVSVWDKTGLEDVARALHARGVEIVSTGSTAATIAALGVPVVQVQDVTGFPECLDGRVKTLNPRIHAGLLADVRLDDHRSQLEDFGIDAFQLLVVNLYPFVDTVASGAAQDDCIEKIDIGGPAMVRAAAKNHANVAVLTSASQYAQLIEALEQGGFSLEQRQRLAAEAYVHTATYDVAVASWMGSVVTKTDDGSGFPAWVGATWNRQHVLRYGENPHQRAAVYTNGYSGLGLAGATQLHGKEMSYNNYVDADAARRAAYDFSDPAVAIIKHANPCGIAVAEDIAAAHRKAHATDPVSAFGGVIAANRIVTKSMAEQVAEVFTEVVVAPGFEPDAVEILSRKPSIRLLVAPDVQSGETIDMRMIDGGMLLQSTDKFQSKGDDISSWTLVAGAAADAAMLDELAFAWRAVRCVKSNAILLAKDGAAVGIGMGQVNRVDSARLAVSRAGDERAHGAVAASDAFFPFADGLQVLIDAGVRAVVEPGGSVRDEEVIAAANAAGITMYFTGTRHFFH